MKTIRRAALALSLTALGAPALAAPQPWLKPAPGRHTYRYTVTETVNGGFQQGYRTGFDFQIGRDGAVDVLVMSAEESADGKTWRPVAVPEDCKAKLKPPKGGIATARLWPISSEAARTMDSSFLDTCAPPGVFFPITDILNVAVIPVSGRFGVEKLKKVGDTATYEGFTAHFDRAGETLTETAHGGEVRFVSLDARTAVIDWAPAPADLDLLEHHGSQPVALRGTEHWAFRLEFDRRTGVLIRARTTYDDLDLKMRMEGVPDDKLPKLKISRSVLIEAVGR